MLLRFAVNNFLPFFQVHKVVCNHLITPELALLQFPKTTRAWIWAAYNFVDDECTLEKLAVRFRKDDAAQDFYNKVQECIEKLKSSTKGGPCLFFNLFNFLNIDNMIAQFIKCLVLITLIPFRLKRKSSH